MGCVQREGEDVAMALAKDATLSEEVPLSDELRDAIVARSEGLSAGRLRLVVSRALARVSHGCKKQILEWADILAVLPDRSGSSKLSKNSHDEGGVTQQTLLSE